MNLFQEIFDKQKAYFDSDATKSYEWRIDQLTRLENLVNENSRALEDAMSSDFKTASQEKVFEIMAPLGTAAFAKADLKKWMEPVDVVVPKALRESGHSAKVYREPYGVTLVIGPFNGPLTLLFDPAVQVIAAGNPCILKLSEGYRFHWSDSMPPVAFHCGSAVPCATSTTEPFKISMNWVALRC